MHVKDKDLVAALSSEEDGVPLSAAVYARIETAVGFTRWLGPVGNYLVARPAARSAARSAGAEADVPLDAAVVLGAAADGLHVWKADPMLSTVGEHLGVIARDRIAALTATTGKSWWPLTIALTDGHELELEARGDVPSLTAAFS